MIYDSDLSDYRYKINLAEVSNGNCHDCSQWRYWPFYYVGKRNIEDWPTVISMCGRCPDMDHDNLKRVCKKIDILLKLEQI